MVKTVPRCLCLWDIHGCHGACSWSSSKGLAGYPTYVRDVNTQGVGKRFKGTLPFERSKRPGFESGLITDPTLNQKTSGGPFPDPPPQSIAFRQIRAALGMVTPSQII